MDDVIELEGIVQKAKEEILKVVMEEEGKELKGIELNEASSSSTDQKIMVECKAIVKEFGEFEKVMKENNNSQHVVEYFEEEDKKKSTQKDDDKGRI